ncbi:MAG TPA: nuclease A inhibitor family protein [Gemmataceae bacterium]|nr:nuclease A inhibitor family protein [Gemmataceae bacterium]
MGKLHPSRSPLGSRRLFSPPVTQGSRHDEPTQAFHCPRPTDAHAHAVPEEGSEQYQKLAKVLEVQLTGVKVYKVGDEAEKAAYIVGKTTDGKWAGLKTTVVET